MPPTSPTVARWELLLRLNDLRKEQNIDPKTAASALKITANHWWQLMSDRRALTDDHFKAVLKLFGIAAGSEEERELTALRACARERGWWMDYASLYDDETRRLYGLEYGAQAIQTYEGLLIPGLLQTENYARALMASDVARVRPVDAGLYIEVRLRRQRRLFDGDPLQLTAIINEAALIQQIGGPEVQKEQLEHLARMMQDHSDTVDIRVVPLTARQRPIQLGSPFHILYFPNAITPPLVWHESIATRGIIEDQSRVRELRIIYESQLENSLSREDSLTLIGEIADRIA
ncbi:DUF5753 domain-containing protein [Nocardia terpenica]|uniref:DUF5753 domain-containing protein n=1 Tax=Nocardia terpenica TaxID=455432 RepID=UPI0002DE1561|nr:DUF5753 domain-containing protein [Nocardia terpenica]NQE89806.1 transcriptional regulator [Nocardia terpenica]